MRKGMWVLLLAATCLVFGGFASYGSEDEHGEKKSVRMRYRSDDNRSRSDFFRQMMMMRAMMAKHDNDRDHWRDRKQGPPPKTRYSNHHEHGEHGEWKEHHHHPKMFCMFFLLPLFLTCFVIHILLTIWTYMDVRKRDAHGIWVAVVLIAGFPGALLYALVRIGDGTTKSGTGK